MELFVADFVVLFFGAVSFFAAFDVVFFLATGFLGLEVVFFFAFFLLVAAGFAEDPLVGFFFLRGFLFTGVSLPVSLLVEPTRLSSIPATILAAGARNI